MKIPFGKFAYPVISFFTKPAKEEELTVVNEDDFSVTRFFGELGLGRTDLAIPTNNAQEIKRRLAIFECLLDNRELLEAVLNFRNSALPTSHERFFEYFQDAHTPYWESIHHLLGILRQIDKLPPELVEFRSKLEETLVLEESEIKVGELAIAEASKISVVEGVVNLTPVFESLPALKGASPGYYLERVRFSDGGDQHVHGYQMFSVDVNRRPRHELPRWSHRWFAWPVLPLIRMRVRRLNQQDRARAMRAMVIKSLSRGLEDDIKSGVRDLLSKVRWPSKQILSLGDSMIQVHFIYDTNGLRLKILGINPPSANLEVQFELAHFEGYSHADMSLLESSQQVLSEQLNEYLKASDRAAFLDAIHRAGGEIFNVFHRVNSPGADQDYRWFAVENLFKREQFRGAVEELRRHRSFVAETMSKLDLMARVLSNLQSQAKSWGVPLSVPTIVSNGNIFSFSEVWPVQLTWSSQSTRPKRILPITNMPPIQGKIVGLSGQNFAGKTVTLKTLMGLLYMVQCGLPVFGLNVRLNPKKVVGGVFATTDEGSFARQLLLKLKTLLDATKSLSGSEVLLLIDELGSGTRAEEGYDFAVRLLRKLASKEFSVVWSGQNRQVFEYAQEHLAAPVIQINRQHTIAQGIGDADFKGLARDVGLDELIA